MFSKIKPIKLFTIDVTEWPWQANLWNIVFVFVVNWLCRSFLILHVAFQLRAMEIEVFGHSSRLFIYAIDEVFFQYRSESIGLKAVDESVLLLLFWHNFFHQVT